MNNEIGGKAVTDGLAVILEIQSASGFQINFSYMTFDSIREQVSRSYCCCC
jgi:hypothetical protein